MPTRGVATIVGRRLVGRRGSRRSGDAGSQQVAPGQRPVDARTRPRRGRARTRAGRPAAAPSRAALARLRGRVRAASRGAPATARARRAAHRVDALERLDGADEQRGRPSGGLGDDVQAVVHPVDKVHVGDPGRPEHDRVAGRPAEPGVRRAVVLADVGLDLDDPPDAAAASRRRGRAARRAAPGAASSVGRARSAASAVASAADRQAGRRRTPGCRPGSAARRPEEARDQLRPEELGRSPRLSMDVEEVAQERQLAVATRRSPGSGRTSRG